MVFKILHNYLINVIGDAHTNDLKVREKANILSIAFPEKVSVITLIIFVDNN